MSDRHGVGDAITLDDTLKIAQEIPDWFLRPFCPRNPFFKNSGFLKIPSLYYYLTESIQILNIIETSQDTKDRKVVIIYSKRSKAFHRHF